MPAPTTPELYIPINNENVSSMVEFEWEPINYSFFNLQISTDSVFTNLLIDTLLITNRTTVEIATLDKFFWRVNAQSSLGVSQWSQIKTFEIKFIVGVEEENSLYDVFTLNQNYPNPFNPTTAITFLISKESEVELIIYGILGERVTTLVNERKQPGNYKVTFDASKLNSGVYIYQLKANDFIQSRKMVFIK